MQAVFTTDTIRSMQEAETVTGRDGHVRLSLQDALKNAGLA